MASTPAPQAAVEGGAEEGVLSPSSAAVGDVDGGGGGGGGDKDRWAVALVLGVFVGIFVLGACWCWCSHLGRKKRNSSNTRRGSKGSSKESSKGASKDSAIDAAAPPAPAISAVGVDANVDEEAATVSVMVAEVTSGVAAAGMTATSVPPSGHDGALPRPSSSAAESATYRGNTAPGSNKSVEDASLPASARAPSTYSSSSFSSLNSAAVSTSLDVTAAVDGGGVGAGGGALVTLTTTNGVSSFATPVNYGEFPQPFSGLDVPVVPYERTKSRSSNGGFAAASDDDDGGGGGGCGGEQQEGGEGAFLSAGGQSGTEDWMAPPEIDVTDLVMDNNEFYTPHGHGGSDSGGGTGRNDRKIKRANISDNEALREAVVMVAVASAEAKALRRNSSHGTASNVGVRSFDSLGWLGSDADFTARSNGGSQISAGTRSSAENTDNGPPSASEDMSLAAAAVEAAAVAAAQAATELSTESDPGAWDTGFSTDQGESAAEGVVDSSKGLGPGPARRSGGNSAAFGSERSGRGGGGGAVPPTPRSLPGLLSMSFSTSMMDEGFGHQPLSPSSAFVRSQTRDSDSDNDNDSYNNHVDGSNQTSRQPPTQAADDDSERMPPPPPPSDANGRKQLLLQKPFCRSSSRYSSDFEDGGGMMLPPLPEVGDCGAIGGGRGNGGEGGGGSVRYPFVSNASTGVGGRGSYGGDTGPALSRIPSSQSIPDSIDDEANALAGRGGGDKPDWVVEMAYGGRGKSFGANDDDDYGGGRSGCSAGGGTGRGSSTLGGEGSLGVSVEEDDDDVEKGGAPRRRSCGTPSSSLTHDAVRRTSAAAMPWVFNGRTLRKIKSIDEGSDEQECFRSSASGLFPPLSSSISSTAWFFRSNGGGGDSGGGTGVASGVFNSCVGLTSPATPDAAPAVAGAAAIEGGAGAGGGGDGARKTLQQAQKIDSGRLTDTVRWHGGDRGGGGGDAGNTGDDKPSDADFNTGPFFLCGGDADGASQVTVPREARIAESGVAAAGGVTKVVCGGDGGGGGSASTGLFDSTKRWFDSVGTVIVGEFSSQSGGQNNVSVVSPSSLNKTE